MFLHLWYMLVVYIEMYTDTALYWHSVILHDTDLLSSNFKRKTLAMNVVYILFNTCYSWPVRLIIQLKNSKLSKANVY